MMFGQVTDTHIQRGTPVNTQPLNSTTLLVARGSEPWLLQQDLLQIAITLSEWTAQEDNLLYKSPVTLISQFQTGRNIILLEADRNRRFRLIGYATFYHLGIDETGDNCWELGTVVVDKERRGKHFGTQVYHEVARLHDEVHGKLFATTKSIRAYEAGLRQGLELFDFNDLPAEIRRNICYDASCFVAHPEFPKQCALQHTLGGKCKLRRRVT
jgi:GNAT superfamily N-acetyltransferase